MTSEPKKRKKASKWNRSHLDKYTLVGNSYIYTGDYYDFVSDNKKTVGRYLIEIWVLILLSAACTIAGGFLPPSQVGYTLYVLIPYILEVAFLGSLFWAVIKLTSSELPLKEHIYASTIKALPHRALLLSIFSACGIIGQLIYILIHNFDNFPFLGIFYMILKLAISIFALLVRSNVKHQIWQKVPK